MHRPGYLKYGRLYKEGCVCFRNLYWLLVRQHYRLFALRPVSDNNEPKLLTHNQMNANVILSNRKFAPKFGQSFTGVLICFVICFFLAQVVRFVLDRENKERTRVHGPPTFEKGLDDLSDRENMSFRYAL